MLMVWFVIFSLFFFSWNVDHRDLHVLTHSFPTRRSSDLAIAAEDARIDILAPSGMTDQEKHFARFYSGGQVVMFARDNAGLGIAAGAEYRVSGLARSEEHTSELQSLMRISYAVFCLKKKQNNYIPTTNHS